MMPLSFPLHRRRLRGGRLARSARGVVSFAAVFGAALLVVPAAASAQEVPFGCPPGSTGPVVGDPAPFAGGMCDLGTLRPDRLGASWAAAVSANGVVVVGTAQMNNGGAMMPVAAFESDEDWDEDWGEGFDRAFRWSAATGTMQDLGTLRTDNSGWSWAVAVNADGSVVVGEADSDPVSSDGFYSRAFRWSAATGTMQDLGTLRADNSGWSAATGVSADGNVVVGDSSTDNQNWRAFRWADGTMQDLGTLRAHNSGWSAATGVSADGNVVVGGSSTVDENWRAFRWADGTMQDLGSLHGTAIGWSSAAAVSADGSVVVGEAEGDGNYRAFRWSTQTGAMQDLGTLRADNSGSSVATGVSADGNVVVGDSSTDYQNWRAFRWADGTMQDLGSLRGTAIGWSSAAAVSADGRVVVGEAEGDGNYRAFRWSTETGAMQDLGTLRADNSGWSYATGVSADGSVVVGSASTDDGNLRAFIWRTQMQDLGNLVLSFSGLANDTDVAADMNQDALGRVMSDTGVADAGQTLFLVGGALSHTDRNPVSFGSRRGSSATLSFGRGIDGQTTVGATIGLNDDRLNANGFDMSTGAGAGLWAVYSEDGVARTGLQAGAAIGWTRASGSIARGQGFDNVMLGRGDTNLSTVGASATLGFGTMQQGWLVTPNATLAHFRTRRGAYGETGADFNASYDALSVNRTTATLALAAERRVTEDGRLMLGAGVERDLDADRVVLSGTSTLPGMAEFSISSAAQRNKTRGFVDIGYAQDLGGNRSFSGSVRVGQAAFGSSVQAGVGLRYGMRF